MKDVLEERLTALEAKANVSVEEVKDKLSRDFKSLEKKLKKVETVQNERSSAMMPGSYSF